MTNLSSQIATKTEPDTNFKGKKIHNMDSKSETSNITIVLHEHVSAHVK